MTADLLATGLILTSALLHASWSAAVKKSTDKFAVMTFISGFGGFLFIPLLPLVPLPSAELWVWIGVSCCIHLVYQVILTKALEASDLTVAYPIARGLGPLLVALFSFVALEGEIKAAELGAVAVLVSGIAATGLIGARHKGVAGMQYAVACGGLIATYTVVDGLAVRLAENPLTLVFWAGAVFAPMFFAYGLWSRGLGLYKTSLSGWKLGLPLAVMAQGGYGLALVAFSMGSLGEIAALRETSILFAGLIGFLWLKEPMGKTKILSLCLVALGAILLKSL